MPSFTFVSTANAFVLRGFSFAHPEQLVSVGLLDPQATPQQIVTPSAPVTEQGTQKPPVTQT